MLYEVITVVSDSMGATANCGTTVTVTGGSGGNNPPLVGNDSYSTDRDTTLNVAAPGVLGNDLRGGDFG